MGRVRICIGNYAKTPYEIGQTGVRVYSLEELCYYLCENAYLLDSEFMTSELIAWVDEELGLVDLARALHAMLRNGNGMEYFVSRILDTGYFCDDQTKKRILQEIRDNETLGPEEKRKKQIDYLAASGRYEQALLEYNALLASSPGRDISLTGAIYHAMGSVAARMQHFSLAEELFEKAYRITYRRESLLSYICVVRLHGTREMQNRKLSAIPEVRELEAEAEQMLADSEDAWAESEPYRKISDLRMMSEGGKPAAYYDEVAGIIDELKEEYRMMAAN